MREDKRQQMLDQIGKMFEGLEPRCHPGTDVVFSWADKGVGFGEFVFYTTADDDELHCSNEAMSKDFIKKMLCQMVDDCVLDDPAPLSKKVVHDECDRIEDED